MEELGIASEEHTHIGVLEAAALLAHVYSVSEDQLSEQGSEGSTAFDFEQAAELVTAALSEMQSGLEEDGGSSDEGADAALAAAPSSSGSSQAFSTPRLSLPGSIILAREGDESRPGSCSSEGESGIQGNDDSVLALDHSMQQLQQILSAAVHEVAAHAAPASVAPSSTLSDGLTHQVLAELSHAALQGGAPMGALHPSGAPSPLQAAAAQPAFPAKADQSSAGEHATTEAGWRLQEPTGIAMHACEDQTCPSCSAEGLHAVQSCSSRADAPASTAASTPGQQPCTPLSGSTAKRSPTQAGPEAEIDAPRAAGPQAASPLELLALLPEAECSASTTALPDELLDGVFREWAEGMQPPPPADTLPGGMDLGQSPRDDQDPSSRGDWVQHGAAADIPEGDHDIVLFMGLTAPGPEGHPQSPRPVPVAPSAEPIITEDLRMPTSPAASRTPSILRIDHSEEDPPAASQAAQTPPDSPPLSPGTTDSAAQTLHGALHPAPPRPSNGALPAAPDSDALASPRTPGPAASEEAGEQQARLVATAIAAAVSPEAAPAVAAASVQGFNARLSPPSHAASAVQPASGPQQRPWELAAMHEPEAGEWQDSTRRLHALPQVGFRVPHCHACHLSWRMPSWCICHMSPSCAPGTADKCMCGQVNQAWSCRAGMQHELGQCSMAISGQVW